MQFKWKLTTQTPKSEKKPLILDPILACLAEIWALKIFLASFTSTDS